MECDLRIGQDDLLHGSVVGDADEVEDLLHVKGEQAVAAPLREEADDAGEEETPAHGRIPYHVGPDELAGQLLLLGDGGLDLGELEADILLAVLALAVVLFQDRQRLVRPVPADQPPGGLWAPVHEAYLAETRNDLQEAGQPPRPGRLHLESPVRRPGGGNGADEPRSVEEASQEVPFLFVAQFAEERRRVDNGEGDAETENPSGGEKHVRVDGSGLHAGPEEHEEGRGENGPATAEVLGHGGNEGDSHERAKTIHGVEETEAGRAGIIEVLQRAESG